MTEMYTSTDLLRIRIDTYVKKLSNTLGIVDMHLVDQLSKLTYKVILKVGQKRTKVKDALIVMLLYYLSEKKYCYKLIAKQLNICTKHITKANDTIVELVHSGYDDILELKNKIYELKTPIEYVLDYLEENNIVLEDFVLEKVKDLVDKCVEDNFLQNKNPVSIGASCLLFILQYFQIDVSTKEFSKWFSLSTVTIVKSLKELKSKYSFTHTPV